jgi:hypothetical protein
MSRVLTSVRGVPVTLNDDGSVSFRGGLTIDADGSARAYGPAGTKPLDYLANAGRPGNWWGVVTFQGLPVVQHAGDPQPGYFISTTSYERKGFPKTDPRRYLDSEAVPFIVVPGPVRKMVGPIVLGCRATVTDLRTGVEIVALVGDFGPATHLGEGSIALARALGINSDPKTGGVDGDRFEYRFWPGVEAKVGGESFELLPA